jgi:hypothetical protein
MAHGRCGADAMPMLSLALQQKVAPSAVGKSIFSLLESFLALLRQKRNFRFLFLNQYKLGF